jgi:hypothetical protein
MNEKIERMMEFILEQQAQLGIKVENLLEAQAKAEPFRKRVEESYLLLVQMVENLDERDDSLHKEMREIAEAQAQVDREMAELAKAQARTDTEMAELARVQAKGESRLSHVEKSYLLLVEMVQNLDARDDLLDRKMAELAQARAQTELELDQRMAELARAQAESESKIAHLAETVDRYISERRNGKV